MCFAHKQLIAGVCLVAALMLLLSSCSGVSTIGHKTIDDEIRASVTSFEQVLYQQKTDDEAIVFFQFYSPSEQESRVGVARLKEVSGGWHLVETSGAVELNPEDGLSVAGAGLWEDDDGRFLCYGIASNPEIAQVEVTDLRAITPEAKNVFRARAHLVSIPERSTVRLWFLTLTSEDGTARIVRGLSQNGGVLVQNRC